MTEFETEFETRLRATLHRGAERATTTPGLASGARRLRKRRRRVAAAAAAAIAVLIAGPTALALTDGDNQRSSPDIASEPDEATGFTRTVSFRDVTVEVPSRWSDGCPTGTEDYAVWIGDVPENPGYSCDGRSTYGIEFFRTEVNRQYGGDATAEVRPSTSGYRPEGAWTGGVVSQLGTAVVIMPTREEAQRVMDSIDVLEGATPDGNGCPARKDDTEASLDNGTTETSLCRYDVEGLLEFSDALTAGESQKLWLAITAAPLTEGTSSASCRSPLRRETLILKDGGYAGTVTTGAGCDERVRLSGTEREVTAELRRLLGILW